MKKVKILIIILSFCIASVAICLFLINNNGKKEIEKSDKIKNEEVSKMKLDELQSDSTYFTIKKCIETYVEKIKTEDREALLEILNSEYIQEKNITEADVLNYIDSNVKETSEVVIKKVLIKEKQEDKTKYYVYGELRNKEDEGKNRKEIYLSIDIDLKNIQFFITPNISDKEVFDEK